MPPYVVYEVYNKQIQNPDVCHLGMAPIVFGSIKSNRPNNRKCLMRDSI